MYLLPKTLSDDIKYFGSLIDEFQSGKIEPVKFKAIRVPMGIYEQRKDGTYMVRVRCSGGFISPNQLKAVADIANHYHSNLLHLTTRQEIQIQNVDLRDTLPILQNLKEAGLSSKGGGGNTVRNILVSVDSGIAKNDVFDVSPYAYDLTSRLIAKSDSFTLPRKFKIAFSNADNDNSMAAFNDLGFIAQIRDGKRGFKVYLGGGVASKPTVGFKLFDFAPEEDLYYIADAAKELFSRYGNRKNKHKARLRFVFYKLGKDEVFRLFFEIFNELKRLENSSYQPRTIEFVPPVTSLVAKTIETVEFEQWKHRYANEQKQSGLWSVIVPFVHGNVDHATLIRLAEFAAHFGDDTLRFSLRQNIHLRNIPTQYLGNTFSFIQRLGIKIEGPLLLNTLVSCTGADTCRLGICLSKGASGALREALSKSDLPLDKLSDLRINISGCPNSCGQQIVSDLGFFGKVGRNDRMYPAYYVVAGARFGNEPKLAELVGEVSACDLPKFTIEILRGYLKKQDKYKTFSSYIDAEGKAEIAEITKRYRNIPAFVDDKNYYFDWGSDQIFSLAAKGVGECSSGLFDMIDVDLNTINEIKGKLEGTLSKAAVNHLLYKLVFASSRMLLITRGAEPKNETEVFNDFIEKFITSKLVSGVFREIIETARDNEGFDFSLKRETILELSQAVINLYDSMDDSIQFKNLSSLTPGKDAEAAQQKITRKDFRGVACPMNFVKTKIELSALQSGDLLEIFLDDGEPIENVPGSIKSEGHKVLDQKKVENYWQVTIEKA